MKFFASAIKSDQAYDDDYADYADDAEDCESATDGRDDEENAASNEGESHDDDVFDMYVAHD